MKQLAIRKKKVLLFLLFVFSMAYCVLLFVPMSAYLPHFWFRKHNESRGTSETKKMISGDAFATPEHPTTSDTSGQRLILLWNYPMEEKMTQGNRSCEYFDRCHFTTDRSQFGNADAVLFTDWVKIPRTSRKPNSINVFFTLESFPNTKSLISYFPENYFHWLMNYMSDAHVLAPYSFGYWTPPVEARRKGLVPMPRLSKKEILPKKTRHMFWTNSHCSTSSKRENAIKALIRRGIKVDIYGNCGDDQRLRALCPRGPEEHRCKEFESYYFVFIGENSLCEDYVTEKYWARYTLPAVPVVMKRHYYEKFVPPNSIIAMDDFAGPTALAEYLMYLMKNPDEYMKYFLWRKAGWALTPWNLAGHRKAGFCRLCEKLLDEPMSEPLTPMPSVMQFYEEHSKCDYDFVSKWLAE